MDQFDLYLQFQKEVAEATLKVIKRFQKNTQESPPKRTSKIDVARHVLKNRDLIQINDKCKMKFYSK